MAFLGWGYVFEIDLSGFDKDSNWIIRKPAYTVVIATTEAEAWIKLWEEWDEEDRHQFKLVYDRASVTGYSQF